MHPKIYRTTGLPCTAGWISRRLAEAKQKRAEMGFDDLLKALDDALRGPGGERLAHRIRRTVSGRHD